MSLSVLVVLALAALLALLVLVFGVVVVVALCRANRDDVPIVLSDCVNVFKSLVHRLPRTRAIRGRRDEEGA
ncbi:hypothetical protein [Lentzea aerocolonigenes]|uniref:hypothetical protein n=1 Tax=Lentzea aerocolonigenes TaxID=68170 RepID=UPI0004C3AF6D|nr:hypothetical protein [Lentzea aerocolonigenes]MCP2245172.1 hypothetical protein [Lentzea aerocolonigenes]